MRSATAAAYKQAIALGLTAAVVLILAAAPAANAASTFYIRGGGNGHGIGMSQYGAYGFALHGRSYRWILGHYYRGTSIGTTSSSQTVRVLLSTGGAVFSGATKADTQKLKAGTTYAVRPNADGSVTLVVNSSGKRVGQFASPLRVTGRGPLTLAGVGTYRGSLEFRADGSSVETVNAVGLDDYVQGVIAAEMPSSWPAQALEAQAVAARTYAITSDVDGSVFDVYSDTRSQMYGGVGAETAVTNAAVAATSDQVVTYDGAPAITYFFSSSGGHTENVENVWPGATAEPWLRGVSDPYDGAGHDPYHHWSYRLTLSDAAAKLQGSVKGSLVGIKITQHGVSPRIITAEVVGTKGSTSLTGAQLQHAFGLLSTWAAFTTIKDWPGRSGTISARDLVGSITGLHGSIFPAPRRTRLAVQRLTGRRWRTVTHTFTGARGAFDTALPGPGSYRVLYRGMSGPSVTIA